MSPISAASTFISLTQPVFTPDPVGSDPRVVLVSSDAYLTINTDTVIASPVGVYSIDVLLSRNKDPGDTETTNFDLTLTVQDPTPCVQNLILPANISPNQRFTHKIGDPQGSITFTGLSNGDCNFSTEFTNQSD